MEFKGTVLKASDVASNITLAVEEVDDNPYINFRWGHLSCHFGGREEMRQFANDILRAVDDHHHDSDPIPD